jgi:pSer/pThr/pTyr-binding forkhead associated (FHA) protein
MLRLRKNLPSASDPTLPEHMITLQIRGMIEKLSFEEGTEVVLGRYDVTASPTPRFDLSHYGAREKGVSREHAMLRFERDQLTITDLKSVNGTFVNRIKIQPNQPHVLHNSDEIALGTLSIVIRFELSSDTKIISVPPVRDTTDLIHRKPQPDTLPETQQLKPNDVEDEQPPSEV